MMMKRLVSPQFNLQWKVQERLYSWKQSTWKGAHMEMQKSHSKEFQAHKHPTESELTPNSDAADRSAAALTDRGSAIGEDTPGAERTELNCLWQDVSSVETVLIFMARQHYGDLKAGKQEEISGGAKPQGGTRSGSSRDGARAINYLLHCGAWGWVTAQGHTLSYCGI